MPKIAVKLRMYTIWPADRDGLPARFESTWQQDARWLVLDITDGLDHAHVVEGPVSRDVAIRREREVRAVAKAAAKKLHQHRSRRQLVGSEVP
jgi:hypothetical protein